jgi:hypothetical protein
MNKKLTGRLVEIFEFQMGIHILSKLKSTTILSMTCLRFQSCNVECEVFIISLTNFIFSLLDVWVVLILWLVFGAYQSMNTKT